MMLAREKDVEIKQCFDDIKTLEVNVVYPFLLEVYGDYEQQRLTRTDFISIFRLIETYVFRRLICGIPTHGLNKIFPTLPEKSRRITTWKACKQSFCKEALVLVFRAMRNFEQHLL